LREWRLLAIDGFEVDLADTPANARLTLSSGRYWILLSRFLTMAARSLTVGAARLPRPFFIFAQTPSAGLRSGA
jgi:hypothetical protein